MIRFLSPLPFLIGAFLCLSPAPLRGQAAVEVQVTPVQLRLDLGQRERLFLSAYDADGNLLAAPAFTFEVSPSSVAKVEADGTVVGVGAGTARIEVRSGTGKATVAVTVTGPPPEPEPIPVLPAGARLVPTPESLTLLRLEPARITVALRAADNSELGVRVTWRSLAPDVATVDASGRVTALQAGQAQLMATGPGGLTAAVTVTVANDSLAVLPERILFAPDAMDSIRVTVPAQGNRALTSGLAWRSSDPAVVRVSPEGIVLGIAPGDAYVLLSGYGQQRTVRVTVHPRPDRLRIMPAPGTPLQLTPGASVPITVQATTVDSQPIAELDYRWQVGDTAVASFDSARRTLTARGLGRTSLTMTTRGFEPTVWQVDVSAGGLALSRPRFRMTPGGRDTIFATLLDAKGQPVGPAEGLAFESDKPEVVTVDARGVVSAAGLGVATVTARTKWGTAASARVYVTEPLLLSVRQGAGANLVQVKGDGTGAPVSLLADGATNVQAAWSPDGTRVAFAGVKAGNIDIYVMDADGQNLTRLTDATEADEEPAWSPDGGTIAFTARRAGTSQIWAMNADGTGARTLMAGPGLNSSPAFSPDGRQIAFISTRDGNADLFEMGNEGADPRPLTRTPEPESHPAYFPNGDLAVAVERPGRGDILRIRAGDGQRIMLQSMAGKIGLIALSGDGATLAFTLSAPGADKKAPPVLSFQLKSLAPDQPPRTVPVTGEVLSASFQAGR
ncbi:MAG TPA: Ig-like domain-containing protein [Gemmatimonadales bacterium]|nr:Ig-like domain-containing protein [Gemmatimonadales bacterium]